MGGSSASQVFKTGRRLLRHFASLPLASLSPGNQRVFLPGVVDPELGKV